MIIVPERVCSTTRVGYREVEMINKTEIHLKLFQSLIEHKWLTKWCNCQSENYLLYSLWTLHCRRYFCLLKYLMDQFIRYIKLCNNKWCCERQQFDLLKPVNYQVMIDILEYFSGTYLTSGSSISLSCYILTIELSTTSL